MFEKQFNFPKMIFLALQRFVPISKAKCFMVSTFDLTLSSCFLEKQAGRPVRMKTTLVLVSYWFCNTLYSKMDEKILNSPEQLLSHPDLGFQGILLCTYLKCVTCTHQEKFGFNTM